MRTCAIALGTTLLLSACASVHDRGVTQLSGAAIYDRLCASCHGVDGKGHGPVAPSIKTRVPDLTRLAWRDGGEFPAEDVHRTIDGRLERSAHGSRDMPVWGWRFYRGDDPNDDEERARVDAMIGRLVDHLRSIQVE
jgi:mono/diheme cytochrome c family protein